MRTASIASDSHARSSRFLGWWGSQVLRFSWLVILLSLVLGGFSLDYAIRHLGVDTDTSKMLSHDLPFQQNRLRLEAAFPQDRSTLLFVVKGETPEEASRAANRLAQRLDFERSGFKNVRIPDENSFFAQEALLYLDRDELENLATELSKAQPFIGRLAEDFSLHGFLSVLGYAIAEADESLPLEIDPLLEKIDQALKAVTAGKHYRLSWQKLILGEDSTLQKNYRFVITNPEVDFSELLPAEESLAAARTIAGAIEIAHPGVDIRITGELALEHEELESVSQGAIVSSVVSLILVCLALLYGLKSARLLFATLVTLLLGLSYTAGFAALAIGHLNLISVAFAVLYIGLGVDYATHLCLRHHEFRLKHVPNRESLIKSVETVGLALFLCALTTAIGFCAFIPTDYSGVSELGIISGAGMLIGLAVSLTLLPALLHVMPLKHPNPSRMKEYIPNWLFDAPFRYAVPFRVAALLMTAGSAFLLTQVSFDSNPVNLRDPKSESVSTFKELLKSKDDSPFFLSLLTSDLKSAAAAAERLAKLSTVNKAITVLDLVPENQEEKLFIIEDLNLILGSQLDRLIAPPKGDNARKALEKFLADIEAGIGSRKTQASNETLIALRDRLKAFLAAADAGPDPDALPKVLEKSLLDLLPDAMKRLQQSLQAKPAGLEDLPQELTEHWISDTGVYRVMIFPEQDLNVAANLKAFVEEVQALEPEVSGLPVADQASGKAVVESFQEAFGGALILITVLLLIVLRSFKDTLLVLLPLLLASIFTGATTVLLDSPFNFANIIALPLLLGIGVDSGIHIVDRLRHAMTVHENPLHTSTARGVFFSSLTTLFSFSSLAFTSHRGIASMGLLLAVSLFYTLFCTLVFVPAFSGKKL